MIEDEKLKNDKALCQRCIHTTSRLLKEGCRLLGVSLPAAVEVDFTLKGTTSGRVYWSRTAGTVRFRICYNLAVLRQNGDRFLSRTPAHEVAHLLVFLKWGGAVKPHGKEWQSVMRLLGVAPEDISYAHSYDMTGVPVRRHRRFEYECGCVGEPHRVSTRIHNKIRNGVSTYRCQRCGQRLAYVGEHVA